VRVFFENELTRLDGGNAVQNKQNVETARYGVPLNIAELTISPSGYDIS
jgi:hypothetical protein